MKYTYNSIQDEAKELRKMINQLKKKIKQNNDDIKDL